VGHTPTNTHTVCTLLMPECTHACHTVQQGNTIPGNHTILHIPHMQVVDKDRDVLVKFDKEYRE
jgi:hypothetical protein